MERVTDYVKRMVKNWLVVVVVADNCGGSGNGGGGLLLGGRYLTGSLTAFIASPCENIVLRGNQGNSCMAMLFPRITVYVHKCSAPNQLGITKSLHVPEEASTSPVRWAQLRFQIKGMMSYQGSYSPSMLVIKASGQENSNNQSKQTTKQKHRPGQSKHYYHFFKRTAQSETGTKAENLVDIVTSLSNVKAEIYAALDEWLAFEVEFPKIALGKALRRLKEQEQWQRIIQVSKWMWSKGQGQTVGTYGLILRAYEMDSRLEDCKILWKKILMRYGNSMPKSMFVRMLHIYKRQQMPGELVKISNEDDISNW
ncbi:hypothetical protein L7F22_027140 [Adiantum nelumboides]|nr:hypothetical protein [Adiantum nelumboides]